MPEVLIFIHTAYIGITLVIYTWSWSSTTGQCTGIADPQVRFLPEGIFHNYTPLLIFRSNYSRFQLTFHSNVPKSFRTSQIRCQVQKFIMKFTNGFVNWAFDWLVWLIANQRLCLQTCLWISLWTFELGNEFAKFGTRFGTFEWKVSWNRHS
jgi:hypothetical protein